MGTHRLNITLPHEDYLRIKDKPNKSAFITEALRAKFAAEETARRKKALESAYREASKEEADLVRDWDVAIGDGL